MIFKKKKPDLKKSCFLRSLFDASTVNSHMYALQAISELFLRNGQQL